MSHSESAVRHSESQRVTVMIQREGNSLKVRRTEDRSEFGEGAGLHGAVLHGAVLHGADLHGAALHGAHFTP